MAQEEEAVEWIEVEGAREHNLQDLSCRIPRKSLTVITGVSGSGKSSLAFDTLYAEGARRYLETFSAYARQFIGGMERPDVDEVRGLSPVISIEQKTISRNPRSTVGTVTEVHDFLRLAYARAADAFSRTTGEPMVRFTDEQVAARILSEHLGARILLLAPFVRGRKGHYRELLEQIMRQGYVRARIDGALVELKAGMRLDRYKVHDIEAVIDRLEVRAEDAPRLLRSIRTAMDSGKGTMAVCSADGTEVRHFSRNLMCPTTGEAYPEPEPNLFSFNSPYGACAGCNGLGEVAEVDRELLVPDPALSLRAGGIAPLGELKDSRTFHILEALLAGEGLTVRTPVAEYPEALWGVILYGSERPVELPDRAGVRVAPATWDGLVAVVERAAGSGSSPTLKRWAARFMRKQPCPDCGGTRVHAIARSFKLDGKTIADLGAMPLQGLGAWLEDLDARLSERQQTILREPLKEIRARVGFLNDVGLGYLALDRASRTLSGGEAQRIRLATSIGSRLTEVLYILDEPSIGLHPRDNFRLIGSLKALRDAGNTVVVVEHDDEIMRASDYLIDIGPGAGVHGGRLVAAGPPGTHSGSDSITARYLDGSLSIPVPEARRPGSGAVLRVLGARGHNLKGIDVDFPLGCLIGVSGVSGSGKSSLVNLTLLPAVMNHLLGDTRNPLPHKAIEGLEHLDKVIPIDQSPIGRTPRSNPATYTGMFDEIRALFARLPEAAIRGYKPGRFSFNVSGGRCEACGGAGVRTIEMNFLPDVHVPCETCRSKRYNRETLEVRFKGKSISDVLDMTVDEAVDFFDALPKLRKVARTLQEVGLGYISLGQPSTTLSGGEAQRVKLATELARSSTGSTLYLLDEPTTGLHVQDVDVLLGALQRLVAKGNTVIVIEHHLDVLKVADHLIDIGPDGGDAGGRVVATGTPEAVARNKKSATAPYLSRILTP
jgi:excinuclease ABC subunit A